MMCNTLGVFVAGMMTALMPSMILLGVLLWNDRREQ
jgi:hypothetical protein